MVSDPANQAWPAPPFMPTLTPLGNQALPVNPLPPTPPPSPAPPTSSPSAVPEENPQITIPDAPDKPVVSVLFSSAPLAPASASPAAPTPKSSFVNPPSLPSLTSQSPPSPLKKEVNFLAKAMLAAGPLIFLLMLAFAFYHYRQLTGNSLLQAPAETEKKLTAAEYEKLAPANPDQVKAYADASKEVELISGQAYPYENPYFKWSDAQINEPGTKIKNYRVSWGESYETASHFFTHNNYFSLQEANITLVKDKTYQLFIQSITDGQAALGFDRQTRLPATKLFEYLYQK